MNFFIAWFLLSIPVCLTISAVISVYYLDINSKSLEAKLLIFLVECLWWGVYFLTK